MPIDQGLSHNQSVNHLHSQTVECTPKEMQILSALLCCMWNPQTHLQHKIMFFSAQTKKISWLTQVATFLHTSARHFLAHCLCAFPPLSSSYCLLQHKHTHTQRGSKCCTSWQKTPPTNVAGRVMLSVCLRVRHRTLEKMNTSAKISLCISTQARLRESESVSISNSNIPSVFTNTSCSCHQGAHPSSRSFSSPFPTSQANCCSISRAD